VIGNEYQRPINICRFDLLNSENVYQIVGRDKYPQRTDVPLAKGPDAFPPAAIHPLRKPETHSFNAVQNGKFVTRWKRER
jgi:hypothetical protein